MKRNNMIGKKLLKEEIEEQYSQYYFNITDWRNEQNMGESIDIDACIHMEVSNLERNINQIKDKYIKRGLDEDIVENIASEIEERM